jgi:nitric oxide reductase NorQ protein
MKFINKGDVEEEGVRLPCGIYRLSDAAVKKILEQHKILKEPYYKEMKREGVPVNEKKIFEACYKEKIPLLLKGPTGTGKTRFIEHMAYQLDLPVKTVACNEDTTASSVLGMIVPVGDKIWWKDGPLTLTVRGGGICYFDEIVEARPETIALIHPVIDYRRILPIDKTGEVLNAPDNFMFVASYNPKYHGVIQRLKPSTKQRFVAIEFTWPSIEDETEIIMKETGIDRATAKRFAEIAADLRASKMDNNPALEEAASTRTLIRAAQLIRMGLKPREAAEIAIGNVIVADDVGEDERQGIMDIIEGKFR